jgi:hypothetical protein
MKKPDPIPHIIISKVKTKLLVKELPVIGAHGTIYILLGNFVISLGLFINNGSPVVSIK